MSGSSKAKPPPDLMEALLKDPVKRALILQLLHQEKDTIEKYKQQELKTRTTPLKKSKKLHCESPTALQRRRALQEQESESSSSEYSAPATQVDGPQMPFDQLLKGVRAYVEVKRDNVDRSDGIKAVMKLMGATIKDKFTNDVTHVVFKDGSFTTYEKARLMKIHLVSVLWLDAIRRHNARVPEKNYPAFGNRVCDANVSVLCSQIQKDYEDIIKDEKRRRHSMMTPKTSISSYLTAQNLPLSEDERQDSPELTSDDSDCGMINGHTSKRSKDTNLLQASPALTDDLSNTSNKKQNSESIESVSLVSRVSARNKRKTINVVSNLSLTPNIEKGGTNSESIVDATPQKVDKLKKVLRNSTLQSTTSTMSSLRVSTDSDKTRSGLVNSKEIEDMKKSLNGGKENCSVISVHSSMSSLRLSEGSEKRRNRNASNINETQTEDREVEKNTKKNRRTMSTRLSDSLQEKKNDSNTSRKLNDSSLSGSETTNSNYLADLSDNFKTSISSRASRESDQSEESVGKSTKKVRRALLQTPKSETERNEPAALVKARSPRRSRRASSVALFTKSSKAKDKSPSLNRSVKKVTRPSPATSDSEFEGTVHRRSRASSVVSSVEVDDNVKKPASTASSRSRRSTSGGKNRRSVSVASSRIELDKKKDSLPSPAKKTRIEAPPTVTQRSKSRRASSVASYVETSVNFKKPESVASSSCRRSISGCRGGAKTEKNRRSASVASLRVEVERMKDPTSSPVKMTLVEELPADMRRSRSRRESSVTSTSSSNSRRSVSGGRKNTTKNPSPSSPKKIHVEEPSSSKKMRKLYNPNDVTDFFSVEENKEREEYIKQKSQKSPDGVFLNPNSLNISPPPSKRKPVNPEASNWSEERGAQKVSKTKKVKKVRSPLHRDSSADEQRDLLEQLQNDQVRRSDRLSMSQTKPKYHFSSSSDSLSTSSLPITPLKRRSTLDFVPLTQSQQKRKLKLDPKRTSSIVCTKMHSYEVVNFENIVSRLGRFFVEDNVTGKTTHLVAGEPKRTINMLRGIARGCWILKHEWLLKSAEEGRWLNEEDYELTEFSPAVQQCRLQREAFGPLYSMDIFKDCGFIYVGKGTTPKPSDLKELISICKGRVTNVYRNAAISVGEYFDKEGLTCVTEKWILDSVNFNKLKSMKNYLIKPQAQDSPHF